VERDHAYVTAMGASASPCFGQAAMSVPSSAVPSSLQPALLVGAAVAGLVLAATAGLWAWYGSAVFYEMVAAGLAACF